MSESQPLRNDGTSRTWGFGATTGLAAVVIVIYFLSQLVVAVLKGKDTGINATESAHADLWVCLFQGLSYRYAFFSRHLRVYS